MDREPQPVAEAVVLAGAAFSRQCQTAEQDLVRLETLGEQVPAQGLPGVRRKADAEPGRRGVVDPALLEITAAIGADFFVGKSGPEEAVRRLVHAHQPILGPVFRAALRRGQRYSPAPREKLDGLREVQLLVEHHELEDVAAGLAAEAIEQLPGGIDGERRGFFLVKGT